MSDETTMTAEEARAAKKEEEERREELKKLIWSQVVGEESPNGILCRRVRLTREQFGAQNGNFAWGVPRVDKPEKLNFAQMLMLEAYDGEELISIAFLANRGVDARKFSATLPQEFWTDGHLVPEGMEDRANAVDFTSWNISGWQEPTHKNPGLNVQLPLEPGISGDEAWQRLLSAAKNGLIRRG